MAYFDSLKAELAALGETLNAIEWPRAARASDPCPRCGRPLERLVGRSDQPSLTCCLPCEAAADAQHSGMDEDWDE
jgi:hypothetical protein